MSAYDRLKSDVSAVHASYSARVSAIRNDGNLSPTGKQARLAAEWLDARAKLDELNSGFETAVAGRRRDLERGVFGRAEDVPAADCRDALDRAERLENDQDALAMLARAARTGDEPLAQAIAAVGAERLWVNALTEYSSTHPDVDAALGELVEMNRALADPNTKFAMSALRSAPPRPDELGFLSDTEAASLAAVTTSGAA